MPTRDPQNPFSLLSRPPALEPDVLPEEGGTEAPKPSNLLGRIVSAAQFGSSGAQIGGALAGVPTGGAFTIPGAVAGGVGGGLYGWMHPTDRPMTDAGASLAEFLGNRFIPGAGSASRALRFGRALGIGGLTAAGAAVGQMGDRRADYVLETDDGPIGIYGGISAAGLALSALARPGVSAVGEAAERIENATGSKIPLTFSEQTGSGASLESLFGRGTKLQKVVGREQNKAMMDAVEKVIGKEKTEGQLLQIAIDAETAGRAELQTIKTATDAFNLPILKQIGAAEKAGDIGAARKLKKTLKDPAKEFMSKFGLNAEEYNGFLSAVRFNPELLIDKLVPTGREPIKQLLAFRGLFEVLPEKERGNLGEALIGRIIQRHTVTEGSESFIKGKTLLTAIQNYGEERLTATIGRDRVAALKDIASVMDAVDPLGKVREPSGGWGQSMTRYVANKNVFAITGGLSAGGGALGTSVGGAITGAIAGATIAIPTTMALSRIMADPLFAKLFIGAMRGDASAATRLVRAFLTPKQKEEESGMKTPASLKGFLRIPQ